MLPVPHLRKLIMTQTKPTPRTFENEEEFGMLYIPGIGSGLLLALNWKCVQFSVSKEEISSFMDVIKGAVPQNSLCKLIPPDGMVLPCANNLRFFHFGRFVIDFNEAELARFREFLTTKLQSIEAPAAAQG